jgi:serine/threonine protein phosphatase 1
MSKDFKLPQGTRVYAIGDIHGFSDVLSSLHEQIEKDRSERPIDRAVIVYLGDYIDRGPNSKGVIDQLIARNEGASDFEHVFLLGNHEDALFNEFMVDPFGHRQDWLQYGGAECVESYGVEIYRDISFSAQAERVAEEMALAMPQAHYEFYRGLKLYHLEDEHLFVHAGIRPSVKLEEQHKNDLTFTREPFMSHEDLHDYYVVHGHTATYDRQVDIRPNRINLDTGLYDGGPLSCGIFEAGQKIRLLQAFKS